MEKDDGDDNDVVLFLRWRPAIRSGQLLSFFFLFLLLLSPVSVCLFSFLFFPPW